MYAVVWLTHTIFPNFSTLPLIDVKISNFLNIFRSNEWILINCVYVLIYICSMLWLIHIIFPNFSTELWPLIDFRIMFKLNILWNNLWIWSNLVDTLIFICQNMRNNRTKNSGGVSCSACNAFISYSSGGSIGGSGGSNEPPLETKLFHFHGEFQKKMVKLHKSNPLS